MVRGACEIAWLSHAPPLRYLANKAEWSAAGKSTLNLQTMEPEDSAEQLRNSAFVDTSLYYLAPLEEYQRVKPYYVNWPVHNIPGAEQTNLSHEKYPVQVEDVRGQEGNFKLDECGFELLNHQTSLENDDFEDDAKIRMSYYPEMVELVKITLNASCAVIFEHTVM